MKIPKFPLSKKLVVSIIGVILFCWAVVYFILPPFKTKTQCPTSQCQRNFIHVANLQEMIREIRYIGFTNKVAAFDALEISMWKLYIQDIKAAASLPDGLADDLIYFRNYMEGHSEKFTNILPVWYIPGMREVSNGRIKARQ